MPPKKPLSASRGMKALAKQAGHYTRSHSEEVIRKLRAELTPKQLRLLDDRHRFRSVECPRRSGKTRALGALLIEYCETHPGCRVVFATITLKRAREIMWDGRDGIKEWDRRLGLGIEASGGFDNAKFVATFPNGSRLSLMGFETEGDIEKARGEAYDLYVLDECASFPVALFDRLLSQSIRPALMDYKGSLVIAGTPGRVLRGAFYLATSIEGSRPKLKNGKLHAAARPIWEAEDASWAAVKWDYSFHTWTIQDNTAMPHLWQEALDEQARNGWSDDNPIWRREYLGQWVADDSDLVFRFVAEKDGRPWNLWLPKRTKDNPFGLPGGRERRWRFGLGIDFGADRDTAIEVGAWTDDSKDLFQVWEDGASRLIMREVADMIRAAERLAKFYNESGFDFLVGDRGGLGKTLFDELEREQGIWIEAALKHDKLGHVELTNSDLLEGFAKLLTESKLVAQMEVLPWEDPVTKTKFKKGVPADYPDAWLYFSTRALHHFSTETARGPVQRTAEWLAEKAREDKRRYWQRERAAQDLAYGDDIDLGGCFGVDN